MPKRKVVETLAGTDFAVIETVRTNADVVVEFIPHIWLRPAKNKTIKVRETAKCYYPRRKDNQNRDQYLKHLKHAKFECLKPENDNTWDLLDCKVLKIEIGMSNFTLCRHQHLGVQLKLAVVFPEFKLQDLSSRLLMLKKCSAII